MGKIEQIKITDMAEDGAGIGHAEDGRAVFVRGAVFGDVVNARITKEKKNYAFAEVAEVVTPSPHRVTGDNLTSHRTAIDNSADDSGTLAVCKYIDECGGCPYGKLNYRTQLELKERHIKEKLIRIGGIENPPMRDIIPYTDDYSAGDYSRNFEWPVQYRNKAVIAVNIDNNGRPTVGFRARKSNRVIDCDYCMIQAPTANIAANILRDHLLKYNGEIRPGSLTGMTVKTAFGTGEVMVVLHTRGNSEIPELEELCYAFDDAISEINAFSEKYSDEYSLESVVIANDNNGKIKLNYVAGKRTIIDKMLGMDFEISPLSFYQVNPVQTEKLYSKVLEYEKGTYEHPDRDAELDSTIPSVENKDSITANYHGTILDLYCGVGTIGTLIARDYPGQVIGIESVKDAIIDANRNAVINGIVNERFIHGKAEEVLPSVIQSKGETGESELEAQLPADDKDNFEIQVDRVDAAILDPPRSGCDESLLDAVVSCNPEKIIYVSCNPGTLARDLKYLGTKGYILTEITPCDMFCHSSHIESISLIRRKH